MAESTNTGALAERGYLTAEDILRIFGRRVESILLSVRDGEKEHRTEVRLSPPPRENGQSLSFTFSDEELAAFGRWFEGLQGRPVGGADVTGQKVRVTIHSNVPGTKVRLEEVDRLHFNIFLEESP